LVFLHPSISVRALKGSIEPARVKYPLNLDQPTGGDISPFMLDVECQCENKYDVDEDDYVLVQRVTSWRT